MNTSGVREHGTLRSSGTHSDGQTHRRLTPAARPINRRTNSGVHAPARNALLCIFARIIPLTCATMLHTVINTKF
ncbi:MAG: hypothetical protein ACRCUY_06470 [Thermoguttaceae bacterium]